VKERQPTPEQAAAIETEARSVMVEAGAGTGKTGTMVDRYCRVVCDRGVSPDAVLAFTDIYPKAPIHVLIVPKRHIASIAALEPGDALVAGQCLLAARALGEQTGYAERGYRVSCNCGPEGGQVVYHLHFHFTAGRR